MAEGFLLFDRIRKRLKNRRFIIVLNFLKCAKNGKWRKKTAATPSASINIQAHDYVGFLFFHDCRLSISRSKFGSVAKLPPSRQRRLSAFCLYSEKQIQRPSKGMSSAAAPPVALSSTRRCFPAAHSGRGRPVGGKIQGSPGVQPCKSYWSNQCNGH